MLSEKEINEIVNRLARAVAENGGRAYYVGGYVRDLLLGKKSKDIDIEIHGIKPSVLENILDSLGERLSIGESFGIYSLKHTGIDIAMPRKEKVKGSGHRDFDVFVDPFIGEKTAALRRDFTVNALMQNILTGEILDYFGGVDDLHKQILRHVNNETFAEDPLRVLRAAQFSARFNFRVAPETTDICKTISISSLSKERVAEEMFKALLQSGKPSVFFEFLKECEQLDDWFPEVKSLIGIPQNAEFHAEGDVWNHTMLVLSEAAKLRGKAVFPKCFMVSALVHDFGKAVTTKEINGKYHAYQHELEGIPIAERFIKRLTDEKKLLEYALNMTRLHMRPNILAISGSSVKKTNALFDAAVSPNDLILLSFADDRGRISDHKTDDAFSFLTKRLQVYKDIMNTPELGGRDLIEAGLKPDRDFADLLKYAHKLHLAGIDKESALKQTVARAKELEKQKH